MPITRNTRHPPEGHLPIIPRPICVPTDQCCNFAPVGGYKITPGPCRGGSDKWDDTKELWKCIDVKTVADCGKACDADDKCAA